MTNRPAIQTNTDNIFDENTSAKINTRNGNSSTGYSAGRPSLLALLKALRKRVVQALIVGMVVGAIVSGICWFVLPVSKHSACAKLWIKEERDKVLVGKDDSTSFHMFQRNQAALVKSRQVISHALDQPDIKALTYVRNSVEPVSKLEKEISVDFRDAPEIMQISLEGDDPKALKALVNAITHSYNYHFQMSEQAATEHRLKNLKEIKAQKDKLLKEVINPQIIKLAMTAKGGTPNQIALNQQVQSLMVSWATKELVDIRSKKIDLQVKLRNEQTRSIRPILGKFSPVGYPFHLTPTLLGFLDDRKNIAPDTKPITAHVIHSDKMLSEFSGRIAEIKSHLKDKIPSRAFSPERAEKEEKLLSQELRSIEELMDKRLKNLSTANLTEPKQFTSQLEQLTYEWNTLIAYESAVQKEISEMRSENDFLIKAELRMEELRSEKKQIQQVVDKAAQQILIEQVETKAPPRVKIIQDAVGYPPPTMGRRELLTVAGGVGPFLLILFAFAWFEYRTQRIDSRDDVVRVIGITPIGSLPDITRTPGLNPFQSRVQAEFNRKQVLIDSADAVRAFVLSLSQQRDHKVLLVTSAVMGEGKTSTAGHLAASLSRAGKKTLLIDCDLRNPSINYLFDVIPNPGMSEVLTGECDPMDIIQPLGKENLFVMTAGCVSRESMDLLSQSNVEDMLSKVREQFDFIILDSSPVLSVPETLSLSKYSDGVILSVLRDVSKLPTVYQAAEILGRLGARIVGFILSGDTSLRLYHPYNPSAKKGKQLRIEQQPITAE